MNSEAETRPNILVPLDLTDLSPIAIEHAFHIGQKANAALHFHHWVKDEENIASCTERINDMLAAAEAKVSDAIEFQVVVRQGDYMKEIASTSKGLKPLLIIIGTHRLQGFEFFVGTHAIRIVGEVDAPVMVVQGRGVSEHGYKHITVPMELEAESKQKLPVVSKMAQLFGATVHLFSPNSKDEFYRSALKRNLDYAEDYLKERGITVTKDIAAERQKDLDHAVDHQVEKHHTELIIITNWHQSNVLDIFNMEDTQEIMMNEQMIPVILVNPREVGTFDLFGWG